MDDNNGKQRDQRAGDENRLCELSGQLTRREFSSLVRKFGFGAAMLTLFGSPAFTSLAEAVEIAKARSAEEQAKKKKADVVLILGMEGTVNRWPDGAVTKGSMQNWGCIEFKDDLQTRTNGKIYVDLFDGAPFGAQTKALRKIQQGIFQVGNSSSQNAAAVAPIWNVLDFPYAIGPVENMWKIMFSKEINDTIREKSAEANIAMLFNVPAHRWLELGFSVKQEVRLPEHLKGLKIRVTNSKLEQAGFKILPANPTPIAWPETFGALKTGAVDGIHVPTTATLDAGLGPVIGQMVDIEFMYGNDATWIGIKWLNNLKPALREAVWESAFTVQTYIFNNFETMMRDQNGLRENSPAGVGWRKFESNGLKWVRLTDDELAAWKDAMSIERNSEYLNGLIDKFGRKAYEAVVSVAGQSAPAEAKRWWKS